MKKIYKILLLVALMALSAFILFRKQIGALFLKMKQSTAGKTTFLHPASGEVKFDNVVFNRSVNNPFNIRSNPANKWTGKTTLDEDEFESFETIIYGIRAGIKTVLTYFRKHKLNTVEGILMRFAPPSDGNDTAKYIDLVCNSIGVESSTKIEPTQENLYKLLKPMALMENSYNLDRKLFDLAYEIV